MLKFQYQNGKDEKVGKQILAYKTGQQGDCKSGQVFGITNQGKMDYK